MIQSRLALAIGPDIEMSKYINKYKLGMISEDWSAYSLAKKIKSCNISEIMYYKKQQISMRKIIKLNDNYIFVID